MGIRLLAKQRKIRIAGADTFSSKRIQEAQDPHRQYHSGLGVLGKTWLERHDL